MLPTLEVITLNLVFQILLSCNSRNRKRQQVVSIMDRKMKISLHICYNHMDSNSWVSPLDFRHSTLHPWEWRVKLVSHLSSNKWSHLQFSNRHQGQSRKCSMAHLSKSTVWKKYLLQIRKFAISSKNGLTNGKLSVLLNNISEYLTHFIILQRAVSLWSKTLQPMEAFKTCLLLSEHCQSLY